jgi:hypothetical protein
MMGSDYERSSSFSVPEIVGIAAAGAAALGGVIVAWSRAQSHDSRVPAAAVSAADSVGTGVARGREAARGAAELIAERLPTLKESASELLAERLPTLKESAAERLTQATERVQQHSGRVAEAAGVGAEQARAAGAALLERVQETVKPAVAGAVESMSSFASDARDNAQPAASGMLDTVSANAGRAMETSTNLAREAIATLFWLLAASALVYLAILSPERREKVKGMVFGAVEEVRLLVRDFQGYDEDI